MHAASVKCLSPKCHLTLSHATFSFAKLVCLITCNVVCLCPRWHRISQPPHIFKTPFSAWVSSPVHVTNYTAPSAQHITLLSFDLFTFICLFACLRSSNSTAALAHEVAVWQSARSLAVWRLFWNRRAACQVTPSIAVGGSPQLLTMQISPEAAEVPYNLSATSSQGKRSRRGRSAFCDLVLEIWGHQFCPCCCHCKWGPRFNSTSGWVAN